MTVELGFGGQRVTVPFRATFGDVAPGELVGFIDSAWFVSFAVNGGAAAPRLALRPGTPVTLSVTELFSGPEFRFRRPRDTIVD